ncbi:MAG: GerAB/ArcD/ProY family transporter [Thermaerobacter sp.]|nr:GerAB/ArcD/ProY family transporter [Thermaerobacter sp.]
MSRRIGLAPWSIAGVSFVVTVCMTPVSLGRPVFEYAGYGTLLWMTLAWGAALLGTYLTLTLIDAPLHRWADGVRSFLHYLRAPFFLAGAAAMLHVWLDILGRTQLPGTPRIVVAMLTVGLAVYAVRLGIENVGRVIGLTAVLSLLPLFLLVVGALPNVELRRLLPFPLGTGGIPWVWPMILFAPRGYDILPVFGPLAKGELRKPVYWGMALGGLYLLLSMVEPQLVFGLTAAAQLPSPFLSVVETITSTYLPFQRIAFLSIIIWQMVVFSIVTAYSTAGIASLGIRVFPLTPWAAVLPWSIAVLALAIPILPEDVFTAIKNIWSFYGIIIYFVIPALLLALGRRRAARRAALS